MSMKSRRLFEPRRSLIIANLTRHFAIQVIAVMAVFSLVWLARTISYGLLSWASLSLAVGVCAGLLAWATNQPVWWRFIHSAFVPLVWAINSLDIEPGWFLLAFVLLLSIYRGAICGRIPLYLSNSHTAASLAALIEQRQARTVIDIGAGIGSVVAMIANKNNCAKITGIENAPLTWLIGMLVTKLCMSKRIDWRYGSLWELEYSGFDIVYAFLSTEPMPELWVKLRYEMIRGSMLVSNSFPVPGIQPALVIEVNDSSGTLLYCYEF